MRLTDAMTLSDDQAISPMRELVRKAEGMAGTVPLRWSFDPRFGYGAAANEDRAPLRALVRGERLRCSRARDL